MTVIWPNRPTQIAITPRVQDRRDRMIEFMGCRFTTSTELAATFNVDTRTVYRDIAALKAAGHDIRGEAGVGYLLNQRKKERA